MSEVLIVSEWIEGEGFDVVNSIDSENAKKLEEMLGVDFSQVSSDKPIRIYKISKEEHRQTMVNGAIYDGHSKANAQRIADGLEALENLE